MAVAIGCTSCRSISSGDRPNASPASASSTGPASIAHGASVTVAFAARRGPVNGDTAMMTPTTTISAFDTTATPATNSGSDATASAPSYFSSLPMKPSSGGKPAIEKPASTATAHATGMARPRPPSAPISRVPACLSRIPTSRNSAAL